MHFNESLTSDGWRTNSQPHHNSVKWRACVSRHSVPVSLASCPSPPPFTFCCACRSIPSGQRPWCTLPGTPCCRTRSPRTPRRSDRTRRRPTEKPDQSSSETKNALVLLQTGGLTWWCRFLPFTISQLRLFSWRPIFTYLLTNKCACNVWTDR